jgi:hypothetical protein
MGFQQGVGADRNILFDDREVPDLNAGSDLGVRGNMRR